MLLIPTAAGGGNDVLGRECSAGEKAEIVSVNKMDAHCLGAPSFYGDSVFIFTKEGLHCFGTKAAAPKIPASVPFAAELPIGRQSVAGSRAVRRRVGRSPAIRSLAIRSRVGRRRDGRRRDSASSFERTR